MSVNKYVDHVLVIPEDDANRQLANGFVLEAGGRNVQVLREAGGWHSVCEEFAAEHVSAMRKYLHRHLVLLLDFDQDPGRSQEVMNKVPSDLTDRVFLLGVQSEPEDLRRAGLGSYENIGRRMASECRDGRSEIWNHELLQQNATELDRLKHAAFGTLFQS